MGWSSRDKQEVEQECHRSDTGQHLWEMRGDPTTSRTWQICEACLARQDLNM